MKKEKSDSVSPYVLATGQKKTVPVRPPKPKSVKLKNEDGEADDIFAEQFQKRNDDDYKEESDDEDMDDLESNEERKPTRRKPASRKRKTIPSDDEEDESRKKGKATFEKKPPAKRAKAPAKKVEPVEESAEIKKIHDSIPTVRAPTPPTAAKKFDFRTAQNRAEPASGGSTELPTGAENCLVGLSFVFTGVLGSISRESGQELVKRYGGLVTKIIVQSLGFLTYLIVQKSNKSAFKENFICCFR